MRSRESEELAPACSVTVPEGSVEIAAVKKAPYCEPTQGSWVVFNLTYKELGQAPKVANGVVSETFDLWNGKNLLEGKFKLASGEPSKYVGHIVIEWVQFGDPSLNSGPAWAEYPGKDAEAGATRRMWVATTKSKYLGWKTRDDLARFVLHEWGHILGVGHCFDSKAVMYKTPYDLSFQDEERKVIRYLYKVGIAAKLQRIYDAIKRFYEKVQNWLVTTLSRRS